MDLKAPTAFDPPLEDLDMRADLLNRPRGDLHHTGEDLQKPEEVFYKIGKDF